MIISDEYKDHIPRRINTIRKLYLTNFILFLVLLIIEFTKFSNFSGMVTLLTAKAILGFAIIGYIFSGNKLPVGIHIFGFGMTFILGFQVEPFTGEDYFFNFDEFTFKTGLILIGIVGLTGMNIFYSLLGATGTLFIYMVGIYNKGGFSYSFFYLIVFLMFGIIINVIINDQYEIEKGMIRLIN